MPAAHVLAWLAPLAELRVFYALANDYFAVLAPSRRALTFQLLWLTTLVPRLVDGDAAARHARRWPSRRS